MATSQNALHHDVLLSNYVQHWEAPEENWYLADEIFPELTVDKSSNDFKRINQATWQQTAATVVGPNGDVSSVQPLYDPDGHYQTKPHALEGIIDHLERDEADDVAMYEQLCTDLPMAVLTNTLELDAFTTLLNPANLGTSYETVADDELFDAQLSLNSNPLQYIRRKCERIISRIGRKPNKVLIDYLVLRAIKFNPTTQMIAPVHTTPAGLQEITIAQMEEKLRDVLEPGSIKVTMARRETKRSPGQGTKKSYIGGNLVIARTEPPTRKSNGAAHKFCFTGYNATDESKKTETPFGSIGVYTYPMPWKGQRGATGIKVITNVQHQIVKTDSIFVALGCVDTSNTDLYAGEL